MKNNMIITTLQYLEAQWELFPLKRPEWGYDTIAMVDKVCEAAHLSEEETNTVTMAFLGYVFGVQEMSAKQLIRLFRYWCDKDPKDDKYRVFRNLVLAMLEDEISALPRRA